MLTLPGKKKEHAALIWEMMWKWLKFKNEWGGDERLEWGGDERLGWLNIWIDDWNIPIYPETLVSLAVAF